MKASRQSYYEFAAVFFILKRRLNGLSTLNHGVQPFFCGLAQTAQGFGFGIPERAAAGKLRNFGAERTVWFWNDKP